MTRPCDPAHAAAKASEAAFRAGMANVQEWPGCAEVLGYRLLQGDCAICRGTFAIEIHPPQPATESEDSHAQ